MKKRLAFSTLGCPDWSLARVVEQAAAMGFGAVELRGIGAAVDVREIPCLLPKNRAETRAMLEKKGLALCGLGTSAAFHDRAKHAEAQAEGIAALAICNEMGIPGIRVFGNDIPPDADRDAVIRDVADGLLGLCDTAAKMGGARVWLEIHGDFNTAQTLSALLKRLGGHPAFGILWDIQHSYRASGNDFQPFYQVIRPFIHHVHIKDMRIDLSGTEKLTLPGEGGIDIGAIVRALNADGYSGWYSFEWEKRWHPELPEPEVAFPAYVDYMGMLR